LFSLKIFQ